MRSVTGWVDPGVPDLRNLIAFSPAFSPWRCAALYCKVLYQPQRDQALLFVMILGYISLSLCEKLSAVGKVCIELSCAKQQLLKNERNGPDLP
jgi:hypothetical protein